MIFTKNVKTEPIAFIALKKLCTFTLIILVLLYLYNEISLFTESIIKPEITLSKQQILYDNGQEPDKIVITFCTLTTATIFCNFTPYDNRSLSCEETNEYKSQHLFLHDNGTNCRTFKYEMTDFIWVSMSTPPQESFQTNHSYYHNQFFYDNNVGMISIYLDGYVMDDKYYGSNNYDKKFFVLTKGQVAIIDYSLTVVKHIIKKYAYGLAGGKEDASLIDFDEQINLLPFQAPLNTVLLGFRPPSMIYYQEESYHGLDTIVSNVGGFFSSLSGIFVFLFGASKLEPWGFLQMRVFCFRYRLIKRFLKGYQEYVPVGIPFVETVKGSTKDTLEERIEPIERLFELEDRVGFIEKKFKISVKDKDDIARRVERLERKFDIPIKHDVTLEDRVKLIEERLITLKDRVTFIEEKFEITENKDETLETRVEFIEIFVRNKDETTLLLQDGVVKDKTLPILEGRVKSTEKRFKHSLEDRVEFLESLLQEYYIDIDFLKLLKRLKEEKEEKEEKEKEAVVLNETKVEI